MINNIPDARAKILETAANIIGRERNINLTIREIAKRAEVNIASVNYYFRSKEKLIYEVELLMLEKISQIFSMLSDDRQNIRDRLINWADSYVKHLLEYPGIIYLIGTRILERENTSINRYLELAENSLTPVLKEFTGDKDENLIRYKVMQLISSLVYPVLITASAGESSGININSEKDRKEYVTNLISSLGASR